MTYKVEWIEVNKYREQKVSLTRSDGSKLLEAKLGREFKGQNITAGQTIEGNEWKSSKNGSIYIFPVKEDEHTAYKDKPVYSPRSPSQSQQIERAIETKNENIGKVMDRKEDAIKLMASQRDAVLIITSRGIQTLDDMEVQKGIIKWRNWFLLDKEFNNPPPFND